MLTKERLHCVYEYLYKAGVVRTQRDFAQQIGANASSVSCALNGDERYLTKSLCSRIKAIYPNISLGWMISGEGDMLQSVSSNQIANSPGSCNVTGGDVALCATRGERKSDALPMVPASLAIKQDLDVWKYMSETEVETCRYPSFPMFPDVKLYYTVRLDAMSPRFEPGDVLAIAPFPDDGTIIAGHPYIIDTYSMGFVFRLVYNRGDSFECKALNVESVYEDFLISKKDVIRLYRVLGLIRLS